MRETSNTLIGIACALAYTALAIVEPRLAALAVVVGALVGMVREVAR